MHTVGFRVLGLTISLALLVGCSTDEPMPTETPKPVKKICTRSDHCEGIWVDVSTTLMWENPGPEASMEWSAATKYCDNLVLAGQDDWHLPKIGELRSLIRGCKETMPDGDCNVREGSCLSRPCASDACSGCGLRGAPVNGAYWGIGVRCVR